METPAVLPNARIAGGGCYCDTIGPKQLPPRALPSFGMTDQFQRRSVCAGLPAAFIGDAWPAMELTLPRTYHPVMITSNTFRLNGETQSLAESDPEHYAALAAHAREFVLKMHGKLN